MTFRAILLALLSLAAWSADADQIGDGAKPAAQASKVARPDDEVRREAVAKLKKMYQADYARRTARDKIRLSHKMLAAAGQSADPVACDAMLSEALRLAIDGEDIEGILDCIDRLAATFTGVEAVAERRLVFHRSFRKPVAAAILKLIDAPDDQRANAIAGKWYAFAAGRWDDALPMLLRCGEAGLVEVAKLETARPANAREQVQVGEAWQELGRKVTGEDRIGMYTRAAHWYQSALSELAKDEAVRINAALAQIMPSIPLDPATADWTALTAIDWERLQAPVVQVQAKVDRLDPQVVLGEHDFVRIVPHPTDTWSFGVFDLPQKVVCTWRGQKTTAMVQSGSNRVTVAGNNTNTSNGLFGSRSVVLGTGGHPYGSLLMWLTPNEKQLAGVIGGPGKLWLGPSTDRTAEIETGGAIRVKILVVDEADVPAPTPSPKR